RLLSTGKAGPRPSEEVPDAAQDQASFPRQDDVGVLVTQLLLAPQQGRAFAVLGPQGRPRTLAAHGLAPRFAPLLQPIGVGESEGAILGGSEKGLEEARIVHQNLRG